MRARADASLVSLVKVIERDVIEREPLSTGSDDSVRRRVIGHLVGVLRVTNHERAAHFSVPHDMAIS